jgi:hypothetical protein
MARGPVSEENLQERVIKAILKMRPEAWVWHPVGGPYQTPGIPDLLVVIDGVLIGIELKFPKPGETVEHARDRATPQQRNQIKKINRAGGMAAVCVSVEESLDLIRRALIKNDEIRAARHAQSTTN